MKKIIVYPCSLFILFLFIMNADAQNYPVDEGSKNFGGDLRISSSGGKFYADNNDRLTTTEIKPYFGYFFKDKLMIGGKLLMLRTSQKETSQTAWGLGPTVRYFFGDIKPKRIFTGEVYFFIECGLFYKQYVNENETETLIYAGVMGSAGIGLCYMLSNSIGFTMSSSFDLERMNSHSKGGALYGNTASLLFGFTSFLYNNN